jgi:predicted pyridoxine 5'-phosphate oxidase superfamily flavin-nucleotide-binding protein
MLKPENYFDQFVLCWLATVSEKGVPNVSPKELFIFEREKQLLIANIASPQSVKNIRANPQVCVSGVNIWTQKGLQCKGKAVVIDPKNKKFEQKETLFKTLIQGKFKVLHIIQIQIETVKEIKAPSYLFIKETTEQSQLEVAKMRYRALFVEQKE